MKQPIPPPRTQTERDLETIQAQVTQGQLANRLRRKLILDLYQSGMSQGEIAARLTRASRRVGGNGVGIDAVEHVVRRWRGRLKEKA